jgi:hypothetical protein
MVCLAQAIAAKKKDEQPDELQTTYNDAWAREMVSNISEYLACPRARFRTNINVYSAFQLYLLSTLTETDRMRSHVFVHPCLDRTVTHP